jgi:hypothetical protein
VPFNYSYKEPNEVSGDTASEAGKETVSAPYNYAYKCERRAAVGGRKQAATTNGVLPRGIGARRCASASASASASPAFAPAPLGLTQRPPSRSPPPHALLAVSTSRSCEQRTRDARRPSHNIHAAPCRYSNGSDSGQIEQLFICLVKRIRVEIYTRTYG